MGSGGGLVGRRERAHLQAESQILLYYEGVLLSWTVVKNFRSAMVTAAHYNSYEPAASLSTGLLMKFVLEWTVMTMNLSLRATGN